MALSKETWEALTEIFNNPVGAAGAVAFANYANKIQPHGRPAADYPDSPHFQPHHARNYMDPLNRAMLDLVNDILMMLQRAHIAANKQLEHLGVRFEIQGSIPLNNLYHLTSEVPAMVNLNIELRDIHFPRRLTQVVRYRISSSTKHKQASLRIMDSKIQIHPPKVMFHMNPAQQEFDIRKFEAKLIARLVDRAKSAFKRKDAPIQLSRGYSHE